ncbi:MAG TPA: pyridoxine 5'-phosphate synthase [Candidatus Deferrimicrobiaceae bacterium]|jgi:pyridoxine 5-phosphate synthase
MTRPPEIAGRRRLGVNIDHIATLRQARGGQSPDPVFAAGIAEHHGADGITIHLREDRRHIQDRDLELLLKTVQTRINLEMAATEEMIGIALAAKPYSATLVPEKRKELTTEGGLDVARQKESVRAGVARLKASGILVSLFIDADPAQIAASSDIGADAIEIHTGPFCEAFNRRHYDRALATMARAAESAANLGLKVFAGHGLDVRSIVPVLAIPEIEEFNIGHSIMARAIFIGLGPAVREIADLIHGR